MKTILILILSSVLTSCLWDKNNQDDSISNNSSFNDSLNNFRKDSIPEPEPCIFSNPDTSVYDIKLLNTESSIKKIGSKYVLADYGEIIPHLEFMSIDKKQVLRLYFHPGTSKNAYSEFEVRKAEVKEILITLQSNEFVTNNEIKLGMSIENVLSKLGNCFFSKEITDSNTTFKYLIDESDNAAFLNRYNHSLYYGTYTFESDTLVKFRFGFEYNSLKE